MSDAPFSILLDGIRHQFNTEREMARFITRLKHSVNDNIKETDLRRFRLGWAMIQAKRQIARDRLSVKDICTRFDVPPNRGAEVCRFAEFCADPSTGRIDEHKLADWKARQNKKKSDERARRQERLSKIPPKTGGNSGMPEFPPKQGVVFQEHPSVAPTPAASMTAGGQTAGPVGGSAVLAALQSLPPRPADLGPSTGKPLPAGRITQPDLPWHLAETAAKLPALAEAVQARVADGRIPAERAHDLQARIDALHAELTELGGVA